MKNSIENLTGLKKILVEKY